MSGHAGNRPELQFAEGAPPSRPGEPEPRARPERARARRAVGPGRADKPPDPRSGEGPPPSRPGETEPRARPERPRARRLVTGSRTFGPLSAERMLQSTGGPPPGVRRYSATY